MEMSTTTVEVKRNTAKLLEEIKAKYKTKSADETIRKLIEKAENVPESMFGAHPEMKGKPFKRDHDDREL